jgi:hypothetical protein
VEWKCEGHATGALCSLQQIHYENNVEESPDNISAYSKDPLFDAIPVINYIVSMLHILIGVNNAIFENFLVWIEERILKLLHKMKVSLHRYLKCTHHFISFHFLG